MTSAVAGSQASYIESRNTALLWAVDSTNYTHIVSRETTSRRSESTVREGGISGRTRSLLEALHRAGPGPYDALSAASLWGVERDPAGRRLRMLAERGWLTRARHGLYWPVPLDARASEWTDDPWLVAAKLYPTGYIGGWSACEHWGLTDQLFRDLLVFTPDRAAARHVLVGVTPITARVIKPDRVFGTQMAWRKAAQVAVSDPSRTVADLLGDPAAGGGIRHVADVLETYLGSDRSDRDLLVAYLERLGNGAAFKRLGYLVERLGIDGDKLVEACRFQITKGTSLLDPAAAPRGPIMTRWNLRINVELDR